MLSPELCERPLNLAQRIEAGLQIEAELVGHRCLTPLAEC